MTFSPRTWSVGEVATAAMFNTEIRDQFNSMFGAWTPYTPAWTSAGGSPVTGNGTLAGRSMKIGRTCTVVINMIGGATTTWGGGVWSFSLPYTAANLGVPNGGWVGSAIATDTANDYYPGVCRIFSGASTVMALSPNSATGASPTEWNATRPFTWGATDRASLTITYVTAT
jgi:hypothetical protein